MVRPMAGRLDGKTALITGGGNGIGRATVLRFLDEGANVVVVDLNEESGRETLELAGRAGHGERVVQFARADVADEAQVAAAFDRTVRHFGRLDVVFNNAGFAGAFGPITQTSVEDFDRTFAVLVRGVFLGIKHGARAMTGQGGGSIINTASVAGLSGGDGPQAYSAAKAAVINLSRAVAIELAPERIRVNAICPGGILTPLLHRGDPDSLRPLMDEMQPWPRHGRPEDIAAAALYLASDDSQFVTGTAMVVDGALSIVGGNTTRRFGAGQGMMAATGMDQGTTGLASTIRPLD
jgi:NAD(P)-dependent dehydrogenase (short-subunit alcohol dehydrogenase family)